MKNIFVSSTFKDMQAERDLIQAEVLPSLRNKARKYGENINMVDLRWGVNTSELETEEGSMKVMSVCLDEVEKSRPYMLVFLGERYGSIINPVITRKLVSRNKQGFKLEDYAISITAMEVEFGVLSEQVGKLENCVVCIRNFQNEEISNSLDRAIYSAESEELAKKQENLKQKLIDKLHGRVINYTCDWDEDTRRLVNFRTLDGESLSDRLVKVYEGMFQSEWEAVGGISWEEKEQLAVEVIKEIKLSSFKGRNKLVEYYFNKIIQNDKPLVLQGKVGSGKTSIMCKLMDMLEKSGYHVFRFVAGNSSGSETAMQLIQQMVYYFETLLETKHYKENRRNLNARTKEGIEEFKYSEWLERLRVLASKLSKEERVYLFIDAIDQLVHDEHVKQLDFVLDSLSMRYVISCTEEITIPETQYDVEEIPDLNKADIEDVVEGILFSMHRNVYKEILKEIELKKCSKSPLYISMLIQRLNMMGFDELFRAWTESDIIENGCRVIREIPDDEAAAATFLIDEAIKRLDNDSAVLKDTVNLLGISRNGIRESDIFELINKNGTKITQLQLSRLLCYLNTFFYIHKDGRINFTHKVIRQGIVREIENGREYERRIKNYLKEAEKENLFRIQEGMYYARVFQEYRFAKLLIKQAFNEKCEELERSLKIEAIADAGGFYSYIIENEPPEELEVIGFVQNTLLQRLGILKEEIKAKERLAQALMRRAEELCFRTSDKQRLKELYVSYICVGEVNEELYLLDKAFDFYWEGLRIARVLFDRYHDKEELNYIYVLCSRIGKILINLKKNNAAYNYFFEGRQIAQNIYEKEHDEKSLLNYIISISNLGDAHAALDDAEKSLSCYEESVKLLSFNNKKTIVEELMVAASVHKKLGNALMNKSKENEAISCFEKSGYYYEHVFNEIGGERVLQELADVYRNLGNLLYKGRRIKELIECNKKGVRYLEILYSRLPNEKNLRDLCDACKMLYKILHEQMRYEEAESYFELCQLYKDQMKHGAYYEVSDYMVRASSIIIVNNSGISIEHDSELRRRIKGVNGVVRIYNIPHIREALDDNILKLMESEPEKRYTFIFGFDEPSDLLRALVMWDKKMEYVNIVGGVVEGIFYQKDDLIKLSRIPKRNNLITKFVFILNEISKSDFKKEKEQIVKQESENNQVETLKELTVDEKLFEDLCWEEDNGGIIITGGFKTKTEMVIPSEINGMPVTTIGKAAFFNSTLEIVSIPDSVVKIGTVAFGNCPNLVEIKLSNSLHIIEDRAFCNCNSLEKINIPKSVKTIGSSAFAGCSVLRQVEIPDSVESIGSGVFAECNFEKNPLWKREQLLAEKLQYEEQNGTIKITGVKDLTLSRVRIPAHINEMPVTDIAEDAFTECNNLRSINMMDCEEVVSIRIPEGITVIEKEAFAGCTNLRNVEIPDSVIDIENSAFCDCKEIRNIEIPSSVKTIGKSAFSGCNQLQSICIPDSVEKIGSGAFSMCVSLENVRLPKGLTMIEDHLFFFCASLKSIELPEKINEIQDAAFFDCTALKSIEIPKNVRLIGDSTFCGCMNLSSIELPDGIKTIREAAFLRCSALESISLPYQLEKIEKDTFWECESLTSVLIPDNVTVIGEGAFYNCKKLRSVILGSGIKKIEKEAFSGCKQLKDICLPGELREIEDSAFLMCENLENVEFPNELKTIGKHAFKECGSLMHVRLPGSLEEIKWSAFAKCVQLREVKLASGLRTIEGWAFAGCKNLINIEVPDSVTYIGMKAFSDCQNLIRITLPKEVTHIYDGTFSGCINLVEISISEKVEEIGAKAFYECKKLKKVELSEGLKTIGEQAFGECKELDCIVIPHSMENLGEKVFNNCSNLSRVDIPDGIIIREKLLFTGCLKLLYTA